LGWADAALSHGDYSFKRVWAHFKQQGWRSQNGHELSYDHYYVKPGKSVREDVEGEDFFLGERALVRYGLEQRIFGEPKAELLGVASPSHVQEVLLSQQLPDEPELLERGRRASRKRQRRPSRERNISPSSVASSRTSSSSRRVRGEHRERKGKKKAKRQGSRVDDPISLVSGTSSAGSDASESDGERGTDEDCRRGRRGKVSLSSSSSSGDESWTGNDGLGGFHDPEDDLNDDGEEDEDESTSSSDDNNASGNDEDEDDEEVDEDEEVLDDDLEMAHGSAAVAGKMRAKNASYLSREKAHSRLPSRPRLKTSNRKEHQKHRTESSNREEASSSYKRKQTSHRASTSKRPHKHSKRSPAASPESFDDDDFSLGADQYGASPPRRPPTSSRSFSSQGRRSAPSTPTPADTDSAATSPTGQADYQRRSASVPSTRPASASHSFLSPSTQGGDNSFEVDEMEYADDFDSAATPATAGDCDATSSSSPTPSTPSPTTSTATSSSWTETPRKSSGKNSTATELASTLLELRDVAFPHGPEDDSEADKYHVLVATQRDGAMRIVLENPQSQERRVCVFRDVQDLPGNSAKSIPSKAVVEALLRCLRGLPGAVIINPGTFSDSKEDTGKIELVSDILSVAQVASSIPSPMTLRFAFPCFDFWRCDHNFPLKLVRSSHAKVASLMAELKTMEEHLSDSDKQLKSAIRDRDELKDRVATIKRERETLQQMLVESKKNSQLMLQQRDAASELQVATLKDQVTQLEQQVTHLKAQLAELKASPPTISPPTSSNARRNGVGGSSGDHDTSARQRLKNQEAEKDADDGPASVLIVLQSPWLKAFMPRITDAITRSQQSTLDWDTVVAIEKDSYFADKDEATARVNAISVLQSGTYQVNAHLTHEKNVRMALRIESFAGSDSSGATPNATSQVEPTLVQLYDNKRRVTRVDRVLSLRANDRVAMVLHPIDVGAASGAGDTVQESWPAVFKPQPNQLALTFLDAQCVYDSAPGATAS
jgi:hypothetical protein